MAKKGKNRKSKDEYSIIIEKDVLNEIHNIPLLDEDETKNLFIQKNNGIIEAKTRLIKHNLRLASSISRDFKKHTDIQFLDIFGYAVEGLINAVDKYDLSKGTKFSTYATKTIKNSIRRSLAKYERTIPYPEYYISDLNKIENARKELYLELDREPTIEEISAKIGFSMEKMKEILYNSREIMSLETPLNDEEKSTLQDVIPDKKITLTEEGIINGLLKEDVGNALSTLPDLDREILILYYYKQLSYREIGEKLYMSTSTAFKKANNALKKIRNSEEGKKLKHYLN